MLARVGVVHRGNNHVVLVTYLGPDRDFNLPENDNLLDPSLLFNTVFIRFNNLSTPLSFFSEGPAVAAVLMMAMWN